MRKEIVEIKDNYLKKLKTLLADKSKTVDQLDAEAKELYSKFVMELHAYETKARNELEKIQKARDDQKVESIINQM